MKVHVHTTFTGAMKLQFGNLPDYDWMVRCHRDDIYQKIVNLTRAANPKWFVMDSLYACQGNGPFSPYSDDLIKDFNTICGGPDPVAVDTICEALDSNGTTGTNVPSTVLGLSKGWHQPWHGRNRNRGVPIDRVKRRSGDRTRRYRDNTKTSTSSWDRPAKPGARPSCAFSWIS
jgi:uncharacterized protein (DUF362 family)